MDRDEIEAELNTLSHDESLDAEIKALNDRLRDIRNAKATANERMFDLRRKLRTVQAEEEEAKRQALIRQANERAAKEKEANSLRIDALTANAPWRDRAFPHQLEGAKMLTSAKRAVCADVMGLGKTLQSVMMLDMLGAKRVLIVCPGDIMDNFRREVYKWSPTRAAVVIGKKSKANQRTLLEMMGHTDQFTLLINYEAWARNKALLDDLAAMRFDTVILDEAHIVKEIGQSAYNGVEHIINALNACGNCGSSVKVEKDRGYSYSFWRCANCNWRSDQHNGQEADRRSVKNVLAMTGTPILNKPTEIFSLLKLTHPEMFPTRQSFERDFCSLSTITGKMGWKPGGQARLAQALSGIYLKRDMATAGIILPPQDVQIHEVELDQFQHPIQYAILKQIREHAQIAMSENENMTMINMLSLITRERQATTWPGGIKMKRVIVNDKGMPVMEWNDKKGDFVEATEVINVGENYRQSAKIDSACELAHEIVEGGQRLVIFSQFNTALEEMHRRLEAGGIRSVVMVASTDDDIKKQIRTNFDREYNEEAKWEVVLCNYKIGGVGLNFTGATQMIILDEEWNSGKRDQAYGRINRIGQTEGTGVHIFRMTKSVDKWMEKLIIMKEQLIEGFDDAITTEQMERELRNMLS